jgi:hypothetical protein
MFKLLSTGESERVGQCQQRIIADLARWKAERLSPAPGHSLAASKRTHHDHQTWSKSIEFLTSLVRGLFTEKMSQLASPILFNQDYEGSVQRFLVVVSNVIIIPSSNSATAYKTSLRYRWVDIKMTLLSELTKDQILPQPIVSDFFNNEINRWVIWQYLKSRLAPSPYPIYVTFDLKLSLQEDSATQKLASIFQHQFSSLNYPPSPLTQHLTFPFSQFYF